MTAALGDANPGGESLSGPRRRDPVDLTLPSVVHDALAEPRVRYTIGRMASPKDTDDLVTHPLKRLLLSEYADEIAAIISRTVPAGHWAPSASYKVLIAKRNGAFREVVYPPLIDSIIARRIVDEFETVVRSKEDGRTFFGRTHASSNRDPGDYESWFKVWQDYTSSIARAAQDEGFAAVFETDIADFFLSIDHYRAREALAQFSGADPSILNLLFDCLESWLPRASFRRVGGLPVEPNDVSRIVAHVYMSPVDELFQDQLNRRYLRFVDDTVIFVDAERTAEDVRRDHFEAIRALGLSPNATKTRILSIDEFEAGRHVAMNRRIAEVRLSEDRLALEVCIEEWYANSERESWDQVARRLYTVAGQLGSESMRAHVLEDLGRWPSLRLHAFRYLRRFEISEDEVTALLRMAFQTKSVEIKIQVFGFLANCVLGADCDLSKLAKSLVAFIKRADRGEGIGYAKAQALIALAKIGFREDRQEVAAYFISNPPVDEKLRMHVYYIFYSFDELSPILLSGLRHMQGDDMTFCARLCDDAHQNRLTKLKDLLARTLERGSGGSTIRGSYLPFLRIVLDAAAEPSAAEARRICLDWLNRTLDSGKVTLRDRLTHDFLAQARDRLLR